MIVFENTGPENTDACIGVAIEKARQLGTPIVVASYSSFAAQALLGALKKKKLAVPVIVVRGVFGFKEPDAFSMTEEATQALLSAGAQIVTATHVLSGAERGLSRQFQGVYPVEIIAHTLRMFGQGTKVCVECATMALDAGLLPYGKPVIAIGGTGKGSDTCLLLTPAHAQDILKTKVHEIYCKPNL
jgi:uncharacterized protein